MKSTRKKRVSYKGMKYKSKIDGKDTEVYRCWYGILKRCYNEKFHVKHPTYIGTKICEEWKDFQVFAEWFDNNYIDGYHLDKDLLSNGEKIYSPSTCIFLPSKVNGFLANKHRNNKTGYIGVSWQGIRGKYRASGKSFRTSRSKHIGYFNRPRVAAKAYKVFRAKQALECQEYMRSLNIYPEEIIKLIK